MKRAHILLIAVSLAFSATVPLYANQPELGFLAISSSPHSTAYRGEQRLDDTPIAKTPLPVGKHTLRLVNKQAGLEKTVVVQINAGETARYRVELWDETLRCTSDESNEKMTEVQIRSTPPANVFIDGTSLGATPLSFPVEIERAGEVEVRLVEPKSGRSKIFPITVGKQLPWNVRCQARF